jgi:hypothetical protein
MTLINIRAFLLERGRIGCARLVGRIWCRFG